MGKLLGLDPISAHAEGMLGCQHSILLPFSLTTPYQLGVRQPGRGLAAQQRSLCWRWAGPLWLLLGMLACNRLPEGGPIREDQWPAGSPVQFRNTVKGDELWVNLGGEPVRLRLLGVYAFVGAGSSYSGLITMAGQAEQYLQSKGQLSWRLFWDSQRKDSYGRWLAYVEVGEQDLAYQMVQAGLLMVYTEFPFAREEMYLQAERQARANQVGLWADEELRKYAVGLRKQWQMTRESRNTAAVRSVRPDPLLLEQASQ